MCFSTSTPNRSFTSCIGPTQMEISFITLVVSPRPSNLNILFRDALFCYALLIWNELCFSPSTLNLSNLISSCKISKSSKAGLTKAATALSLILYLSAIIQVSEKNIHFSLILKCQVLLNSSSIHATFIPWFFNSFICVNSMIYFNTISQPIFYFFYSEASLIS